MTSSPPVRCPRSVGDSTSRAHPNHRLDDATIAGVVRLLGCDALIVPSAVPMLLVASVKLPCDPPSYRISRNSEVAPGTCLGLTSSGPGAVFLTSDRQSSIGLWGCTPEAEKPFLDQTNG